MPFRWLALLVFASALVVATGCKKKKNQAPPEERGTIFKGEDAVPSGPDDRRYGSQGQVTENRQSGGEGDTRNVKRTYKNCRKSQPVIKDDPTTAEGTLRMAFGALMIKDENESFEKFLSFVDPDFQSRDSVRRYWFKQARLYDEKKKVRPFFRMVYADEKLPHGDDPSYDICSTRPEGDGIRIFVGKSPPVGSNPPYVLHKVGEKWLIKNFTAH